MRVNSFRSNRPTRHSRAERPRTCARKSAGVRPDCGVSVDSIEKNSPASDVLAPGDMVMTINDAPIADSDQFAYTIGITPIDQPAKLSVIRDGKSMNIAVN